MKTFLISCCAFLMSPFIFAQCLITGGDLSYVNTIEQNGGTYRDANGCRLVLQNRLFKVEGKDETYHLTCPQP